MQTRSDKHEAEYLRQGEGSTMASRADLYCNNTLLAIFPVLPLVELHFQNMSHDFKQMREAQLIKHLECRSKPTK